MSPVDVSTKVKYEKNVAEHIIRIETDECEICKQKIKKKRKNLFFQQLFVIHVKRDGTITWEELK